MTNEQTFGHLFEQELRKRKIDAEVVNLGKGNEQSDHALARLDATVIALKPDIVTHTHLRAGRYDTSSQSALNARNNAPERAIGARVLSAYRT